MLFKCLFYKTKNPAGQSAGFFYSYLAMSLKSIAVNFI